MIPMMITIGIRQREIKNPRPRKTTATTNHRTMLIKIMTISKVNYFTSVYLHWYSYSSLLFLASLPADSDDDDDKKKKKKNKGKQGANKNKDDENEPKAGGKKSKGRKKDDISEDEEPESAPAPPVVVQKEAQQG